MRTICLLLLICSTSFGQMKVDVQKSKAVVGVVAPKLVGDVVLIGEGSKPTFGDVAIITVDTKAKFIRVTARKSLLEFGALTKISPNSWVLSSPGKYSLEVDTFDSELGVDTQRLVVELGGDPGPGPTPDPPGPGPDPNPTPVPSDEFDNIGQRVAKWSDGLPKKKEVAAIFLDYATKLESNPTWTINTAADGIVKDRTALLGVDAPKYNPLIANLNADMTARWPMARGVLVAWWRAIAAGLDPKVKP